MRAEGWIVVEEASEKTGVAQSTLRAWVAAKKVESRKASGVVFVGLGSAMQAAGLPPPKAA